MALMKVRSVHSQNLGQYLPLGEGDNSFRPSGKIYEEKPGERALDTGYITKEHSAQLKLKLQALLAPERVSGISMDTLTIDCDRSIYVMNGAHCIGEAPEISAGGYSVTFSSPTSSKI